MSAGGRRRPGRGVVGLGVAMVVGIVMLAVGLDRGVPVPLPGFPDMPAVPTRLPISTGGVVESPAPGQTAVIAADTVPLSRPTFEYQGTQPWQIHRHSTRALVLEGYASRPSYLPGESLRLAVSTTASTYDLTIWRVAGAAPVKGPFVQMASIGNLPGRRESAPAVDPVTRIVAARWPLTYAFTIPATWPSGVYLVRLASSQDVQSYVPFVVRSASAHQVLVVASVLNWQAYNLWGGSNLYQSSVGEPVPGVRRAIGVSFDRPYATDDGAGQLFFLELPFISWLERQGLDVAYTTDYDLSVSPDAQPLPRVVVFNGHDEYWGVPLYDWLDRHLNAGDISIASFAADTGFWPVSFDRPSADGPRDVMCLKLGPIPRALLAPGQTAEPSEGPGATLQPGETEERAGPGYTAYGPDGPYVGSFPDQPLFGVRYRGITEVLGRYTLVAAGSDQRLLDGTGLAPTASLGFIAGGEVDGVYPFPEYWGPQGGAYDHRFASAMGLRGRNPSTRWTADAVWRELPSHGRVFSAGTFYWGWALDPAWGAQHEVPPGFARLTRNILSFLAAP